MCVDTSAYLTFSLVAAQYFVVSDSSCIVQSTDSSLWAMCSRTRNIRGFTENSESMQQESNRSSKRTRSLAPPSGVPGNSVLLSMGLESYGVKEWPVRPTSLPLPIPPLIPLSRGSQDSEVVLTEGLQPTVHTGTVPFKAHRNETLA